MSGLRLGYGMIAAAGLAGMLTVAVILPAMTPPPRSALRAALGLDTLAAGELARREGEAIAMRTVACLRAAGIQASPVVDLPPQPPDADLDPVTWAERWGFGVSTSVGQPSPSAVVDANLVAATSRGPEARAAYLAAFLGDGSHPGCQASASDSVLGLRTRVVAPLATELAALDAAIEADPVVTVALAAWRTCIRPVAGRSADGPPAAVVPPLLDEFAARVAALGPRRVGLGAVQADERRVASTLARCDRTLADARAAVAARLESAFVDTHRAALRAMRTTFEREMAAWPTMPP